MPFRRRRKVRLSTVRQKLKQSDTSVATIGPGTTPITRHVIIDTYAGARDTDGGSSTVQSSRTTASTCQIGDIVKYFTCHVQVSPTDTTQNNDNGWLEYAVIHQKEGETDLTNTNLGTRTLGDAATQYYRNECIWTGAIPVGLTMPNSTSIPIKVPKQWQTLKYGDEFALLVHFRSNNSASAATNLVRVILSHNMNSYG